MAGNHAPEIGWALPQQQPLCHIQQRCCERYLANVLALNWGGAVGCVSICPPSDVILVLGFLTFSSRHTDYYYDGNYLKHVLWTLYIFFVIFFSPERANISKEAKQTVELEPRHLQNRDCRITCAISIISTTAERTLDLKINSWNMESYKFEKYDNDDLRDSDTGDDELLYHNKVPDTTSKHEGRRVDENFDDTYEPADEACQRNDSRGRRGSVGSLSHAPAPVESKSQLRTFTRPLPRDEYANTVDAVTNPSNNGVKANNPLAKQAKARPPASQKGLGRGGESGSSSFSVSSR